MGSQANGGPVTKNFALLLTKKLAAALFVCAVLFGKACLGYDDKTNNIT
jgi:hypothetical protein